MIDIQVQVSGFNPSTAGGEEEKKEKEKKKKEKKNTRLEGYSIFRLNKSNYEDYFTEVVWNLISALQGLEWMTSGREAFLVWGRWHMWRRNMLPFKN